MPLNSNILGVKPIQEFGIHPVSSGTATYSPVKKSKKIKIAPKKATSTRVLVSSSDSYLHVVTKSQIHHPPEKVLSDRPHKRKSDEVEDLKRQIACLREEFNQQSGENG